MFAINVGTQTRSGSTLFSTYTEAFRCINRQSDGIVQIV